MVLSGVGDAVGYRNGAWEFCNSGAEIHAQLRHLGGLAQLTVDSMTSFILWCLYTVHFTDLHVALIIIDNESMHYTTVSCYLLDLIQSLFVFLMHLAHKM